MAELSTAGRASPKVWRPRSSKHGHTIHLRSPVGGQVLYLESLGPDQGDVPVAVIGRRWSWIMERRQRMSRGCIALHRLRSEARTCALLALLGMRRSADSGLWKARRRHEPLWSRYSLSSAEGREQEINRRTDPEYSYGYGFRVSAGLHGELASEPTFQHEHL